MQRTRAFLARHSDARVFVNLDAVTYWSLLGHVALLIGNSSSGIMEAASFALPVVNVGFRQKGRERARNVLDAAPEATAITAAIDRGLSGEFRASLAGMTNPYGDGHAAETIVQVLVTTPLGDPLLIKHAPDAG
jgi:UDP-N-acetylglucosamine 2-epimerase (non-hydrolysing)/GDP/UDP-N,N'-diacetylbacillosamine 2-epimerase (hydrolysing)